MVAAGVVVLTGLLAFAPAGSAAVDPDNPQPAAVSVQFLSGQGAGRTSTYIFVQVPNSCQFGHFVCPSGYATGTDTDLYMVVTRGGQVIAQTIPGDGSDGETIVPTIEPGDTVTVYGSDGASDNGYRVAATAVYEPPPSFIHQPACIPGATFVGHAQDDQYVEIKFAVNRPAVDETVSNGSFSFPPTTGGETNGTVTVTGISYVDGPDGLVQISETPPPLPDTAVCGSPPTNAQIIRVKLHDALIPPAGPQVTRMAKRGSYTTAFTALSAGRLTITWTEPSKRGAKGPTALLASAHATIAKPGRVRVVIRLTVQGKALLRHTPQPTVRLQGSFTPAGGHPISVTGTRTLYR